MPFTSPATLHSRDDREAAAGGYSVVFRIEELDWVADWYEEATAIQLPSVKEWLRHARPEHRWFATFRPGRGETAPHLDAGPVLTLELQGTQYVVEQIDEIHGVLGTIPWQVLAGTGDVPPEPSTARA